MSLDQFGIIMPDLQHVMRVMVRLGSALIVGTAIGLQRELTHKPAGLRTHMLVAVGTALFIVGPTEAGMDTAAISRILQGLATGIGFLGAGAILKLATEREIHGLTTAAGVWMTAAASAIAALGQIVVAFIGTALGLLVLGAFRKIEHEMGHHAKDNAIQSDSKPNPKDIA
jgi:putative Mg2+ transporter-C (MgtC) family protein